MAEYDEVLIVNIYAPSGGSYEMRNQRKMFFDKISNILSNKYSHIKKIILLDDFNTILENIDTNNNKRVKCPSENNLTALLNEHNLEDHWRKFNPFEILFSYYFSCYAFSTRLDRICWTINLRNEINIFHKYNAVSDHYQRLVLEFKRSRIKHGKSQWCFNNSLLGI